MGTVEYAPARGSLGWWPNLILWGVVIAFGYLYLSSVDKNVVGASHSIVDSASSSSPSPSSSPLPVTALPDTGYRSSSQPVAERVEPAKGAGVAAQPSHPKPVVETESAVFARSLMNNERPADQAPASVASTQSGLPATESTQARPGSAVSSAPVATSAPPASAAAPATVQSRQPVAEPSRSWPARGQSLTRDDMVERQARIMAQHEAMRRAADERMRQYWGRMRAYAPAAAPYGYPGYALPYAPRVQAPGFQPPLR